MWDGTDWAYKWDCHVDSGSIQFKISHLSLVANETIFFDFTAILSLTPCLRFETKAKTWPVSRSYWNDLIYMHKRALFLDYLPHASQNHLTWLRLGRGFFGTVTSSSCT
jgi:hypothetical protein